jgi:hypothetical protein
LTAARERELIAADFCGRKGAIRDAVRRRAGGEASWQALQADIYGEMIVGAAAFPGTREFILRARELGSKVAIVSHKTPFAAGCQGATNLHAAARSWLFANGLIGTGVVAESDLYFESSRDDKLARICALDVDIAIDDLVEVLTDPHFPQSARRWLFAPGSAPRRFGALESFDSWNGITEAFERLTR